MRQGSYPESITALLIGVGIMDEIALLRNSYHGRLEL
jgi:hypothetical protein